MITTSTHPTPFPSDTPQPIKLTKQKKKALAFRDKTYKNKTKNTNQRDEQEVEMEDLHVLDVEKSNDDRHARTSIQMGAMENQGREGTSGGSKATSSNSKRPPRNTIPPKPTQETHAPQKSQQKHKRVGKHRIEQHGGDIARESERLTKKRKREQLGDLVDDVVDRLGKEGGDAEQKANHKKRKTEKAESRVDRGEEESEREEISEGEGETEKGKRKEQRFILFVGNLKYTTSVSAIRAHFSACDPPPEVRLLTPKASTTGKTTTKSKGCAFLEFKNKVALQQALKQHHSELDGRMINVELTAGGGGKGEQRMEKLRKRNSELLGQRKKKVGAKEKDDLLPQKLDKSQRYSGTSGLKKSAHEGKRTWAIGDVAEDKAHRGGLKHNKTDRTRGSRKSKTKDWGTGVNAIPVI